jgi:predicted TIM-barrel fold metal-dependent hydrolase
MVMDVTKTDQLLIDVHAHFLTDAYVSAARDAGHIHPDGMAGWPHWSAEDHLQLMDRWGVATAMLSISSPGTHFGDDAPARRLTREVNEAGAAISRDHPGRFGHFASLPLPDVTGALDELGYAFDKLDSDGITIQTNSAGVYLGDDRYEPLYRELNRRRAVVFVHPTSPPYAETIALGRPRPMLEFIFDTTRAVSNLVFTGTLIRYPDIEWVFTHGGGTLPLLAERMELFRTDFLGNDDALSAVPRQLTRLWFDIAGTPFPHQVPAAVAAFGAARLLYGSDYCWTPAHGVDAQLAFIDQADQPADDSWRALTTRNAIRLLR